MPVENEYVTKQQLAGLLKKSPRTIEIWTSLGYLPYVKIRRSILFPIAGVRRALTKLERNGGEL